MTEATQRQRQLTTARLDYAVLHALTRSGASDPGLGAVFATVASNQVTQSHRTADGYNPLGQFGTALGAPARSIDSEANTPAGSRPRTRYIVFSRSDT